MALVRESPARSELRLIVALLGLSAACHPRPHESVEPALVDEAANVYAPLFDALDDPARAAAAHVELRRVAVELAAGDEPTRAAAAAELLPGLAERWPGADEELRGAALFVALTLADPEAGRLWQLALASGASAELLLAVEGLRRIRLRSLGHSVAARLELEFAELADDTQDDDPRLRATLALIGALGDLRAEGSVDMLIDALEHRELPRSIQRELISALGRIGNPRAVDALIAAQFRIPDFPHTQSIGERSIRALGAIGEDALPGVLATYAGNNRRVNQLADEVGLPPTIVRLSMVRVLGVIGSPRATEPLLAGFPRAGCDRNAARDDDDQLLVDRAFGAHSLGFIADPGAVASLCACNGKSESPVDMGEIAPALGRIGGDQALACLASLVEHGRYNDSEGSDPDYEFEIRPQSFRWAVIAAPASELGALNGLLRTAAPKVRAAIEREQLDIGLGVLQACGEDRACYRSILVDRSRHPYEREVAAFNLARRATPGDLELAAALAAAFEAPDPEVRVNMAWLTAKVAAGRACPACVAGLEQVLTAEDTSKTASMQAAWIMARQTIDKLHAGKALD
jgi:hypothetical protein